ncbi:hypothetical protein FSP39_016243 [Pinctada imbricata]|uniref:Motile sperm domain-containing protein 2 n=1 Tax=Pinctada imbricata TaxID=66713 RepID=A0AA89BXH8_PINIB|nr:hypothetical protein FSP39_016243 [Pinctada imbricata]
MHLLIVIHDYIDNISAELQSQGIYDQRDVENVASNDLYVSQFIRESETIQDAADRLHEALKFRCEIKVRDITEESLPREAWEAGGIFYHNTDKDGRRILWFKVKLHKKDAARLIFVKRFIMYHFETTYNESPEEQIVVLFDMSGAGISNLDMEMIKFVITSFKIYYPKLLGFMLIYEMPWLFNAAWKVIKTWLSPEAVKKIKFVTKSDVQEYIDKDQLPEHMGGTDQYKYVYIPPEERDPIDDCEEDKSLAKKKQVTFADQSMTMYRSFNGETKEDMNNSADNQSQSTKPSIKPQIHRKEHSEDNAFVGRLLTIWYVYITEHSEDNAFVVRLLTIWYVYITEHSEDNAFVGRLLTIWYVYITEHSEDNAFVGRLLTIWYVYITEHSEDNAFVGRLLTIWYVYITEHSEDNAFVGRLLTIWYVYITEHSEDNAFVGRLLTIWYVHITEHSEDNAFVGRLLTICPADELVFTSDEQGKDAHNTISLKNTLPYQIAFKVKTTSPEKYKVRPSSGIVKPGSTADVYVHLHQGYYSSSVDKDKFLIMAMEMTGDAPDNLMELWKSVQRENVMEHRLQCTRGSKKINASLTSDVPNGVQPTSQDRMSVLSKKIDALVESNHRLQHTVYLVMLVQLLLFIIICVLLFYTFMNPSVPVNSTVHSFCGSGLF